MRFVPFIATLAVLPAAFASPIDPELQTRASTCSASDINKVKKAVEHPAYFCEFYTATTRKSSPFSGLSVSVLDTTCACIIKSSGSTSKPKATTVAKTGSKVCSASALKLVNSEYTSPSAFCSFFNSGPKNLSSISGLTPQEIYDACDCVLGKATTSSAAIKTWSNGGLAIEGLDTLAAMAETIRLAWRLC